MPETKRTEEQGYIFWPFPPPHRGKFFVHMINREEFEGGLEKRRGKGGKKKKTKKRVIKHTLKYLYEA